MDRRIKDETNKRFGRLVVKNIVSSSKQGSLWLCVCDCGNEKVIRGHNLRLGLTRSCGCLQKERARENILTRWNMADGSVGRRLSP